MRTQAILTAATAFFALAAAVPYKRDVAVDTVTEVDTVVEVVTKTVWVDPSEAPKAHETTSAEAKATSPAAQPSQPAAPPANNSPAPAPSSSPSTTSTSTSTPPPPPATTSSAYVAPPAQPAPEAPTTTQAPAPVTTQAAPTSADVAPASAPSGGSSSGGQKYTGADLTYYDPSVGFGSCGWQNGTDDKIVAVAAGMMNKGTMCGKQISITYESNTVLAYVTDTCPGCAGTSLDLSSGVWKAITVGTTADGRVHGASWSFTS